MMTASGEPSAYYPMDSNGLAVQNAPAQPCVCAVVAPTQTAACPPLGYGGCEGGECGETNSPVFLIAFRSCMPPMQGVLNILFLTSVDTPATQTTTSASLAC